MADVAFGTTLLLPKMEVIPDDFSENNQEDRLYFKIVNSLFYGFTPPEANVEFKDGFEPNKVLRVVRAHLASWESKHEDKILAVAYMLKCMCTIMPKEQFGSDT